MHRRRALSFLPVSAALTTVLALALAACRRDEGDRIEGTGTLEVVEVDVAPMTPARVLRVWRQEGDTVREGDTLVSLTQSTVRADVDARPIQCVNGR